MSAPVARCGLTYEHDWHAYRHDTDDRQHVCDGHLRPTTDDPTTAALTAWLAEHAPGTDHDKRIIENPGEHPSDTWYDPGGKHADRAAATARWGRADD